MAKVETQSLFVPGIAVSLCLGVLDGKGSAPCHGLLKEFLIKLGDRRAKSYTVSAAVPLYTGDTISLTGPAVQKALDESRRYPAPVSREALTPLGI